MKIRIYYEDTDSGGIVYHANYIKYCERARSELIFSSGLKFDNNCGFVVKEIACKYLKPSILGDILEVRTIVKSCGGASINFKQEIYKIQSLDGNSSDLVFTADILVAFVKNQKPSRLPFDVLKFFKDRLN